MADYDLSSVPTVARFMKCRAYQQILMGPFGSGKSSGVIQKLCALAARQPPWKDGIRRARTAVIRNSYPQLKDTTISTWMDWYDPQAGWGRYSEDTKTYFMRWRDGNTGDEIEFEVRFRALDRPDQVGNLLSSEYTNAWCNESRELPLQVWDAICGRVSRYPPRKEVPRGAFRPCVIGDTNPPDTDHWQYKRFEEHQAPDGRELTPEEIADLAIFKQPAGNGPDAENLPNLDPNYYRRLASGKSEDYVRVYVEGRYGYVQEGKPVYPEYNDTVHCREFDVDPRWPSHRGFDFGLSPAGVMVTLTPAGQLRIFDEVVATRMGAGALADEMNLHCATTWPRHTWQMNVGDPAGATPGESEEKSCFRAMSERGISLIPGRQTIERRLGAVRGRLTTMIDGEPGLLIHPRCRVLRKGFQGAYKYRRKRVTGERYEEKPDKDSFSHPHDALQYICTVLFTHTGNDIPTTKPRVRRSR